MEVYNAELTDKKINMTATKSKNMVVKLSAPNIMSVCWIIICLKIIVSDNSATRNIFDYFLFGSALVYMMISAVTKKLTGSAGKKILEYFLILLVISVIGVVRNLTTVAIISVIGVLCVLAIVLSCGFYCNETQSIYIRPMFYLVILRLLIRTVNGDYLGNTTPGVLCFLTYSFIISVMVSWGDGNHKKNRISRAIDLIQMVGAFILMVYISWESNARTTVLTSIGIIAAYMYISVRKYDQKKLNRFFWIMCIAAVLLTAVYINIHSFSWYGVLNQYSQSSFGKNVDSSRPALWSYSLQSLSWLEFIIGKGTGILPTFRTYQSFHNSFLQLIMQNGLLGLIPLILIFRTLWSRIAEHSDDKVCRMIIACIIGIIVYNLFECTLLQNKVFMGMCEWILICMGVVRSRQLDIKDTYYYS